MLVQDGENVVDHLLFSLGEEVWRDAPAGSKVRGCLQAPSPRPLLLPARIFIDLTLLYKRGIYLGQQYKVESHNRFTIDLKEPAMPRPHRSDGKVWKDIKKINKGVIFKEEEIENLVVESMSIARNGNSIHENATGMVVEVVRNICCYHKLTKNSAAVRKEIK